MRDDPVVRRSAGSRWAEFCTNVDRLAGEIEARYQTLQRVADVDMEQEAGLVNWKGLATLAYGNVPADGGRVRLSTSSRLPQTNRGQRAVCNDGQTKGEHYRFSGNDEHSLKSPSYGSANV